jgi:hypothetical protein
MAAASRENPWRARKVTYNRFKPMTVAAATL